MDVPVLIGSLTGTVVFVCFASVAICLCYRYHIKRAKKRYNTKTLRNYTPHMGTSPVKLAGMIRGYFREQENKESDVFHIQTANTNADDDQISELDIERAREANETDKKSDVAQSLMSRAIICSSAKSLYTNSELLITDETDDPLYDIDNDLQDSDDTQSEDTETEDNADTDNTLGSIHTIYTAHQSEESDNDTYPPVEERSRSPFQAVDNIHNAILMDAFNINCTASADSAADTAELSSIRLQRSTRASLISIEVDNELDDTAEGEPVLKQDTSQRCDSQSDNAAKLTEHNHINGVGDDAENFTEQNTINANINLSSANANAVTDNTERFSDHNNINAVADNAENVTEKENNNTVSGNVYNLTKQNNNDENKEKEKKPVKRRKSKRPQTSHSLKISDSTRPSKTISPPRHVKAQTRHTFTKRLEERFRQQPEDHRIDFQNNISLTKKRKRGGSSIQRSKSLSQSVLTNKKIPMSVQDDVPLKPSLSTDNKINKKRSISFKSPEPTPDSGKHSVSDTHEDHTKTCAIKRPSTASIYSGPISLSQILFDEEDL